MPTFTTPTELQEKIEAKQNKQQIIQQAKQRIDQIQAYRDALPDATPTQLKIGLDKIMENQQIIIRLLAREILD